MLLDFEEHLLNLVLEELQLLIHMVDLAVYVHVGPLGDSDLFNQYASHARDR